MDRKLGGLALLLFSAAAPAQECDWKVSEKIDPMTDKKTCIIASMSAKIGVSVRGEQVIFVTPSAYKGGRDGLELRIDDNQAIWIGEHSTTDGFRDNARRALAEIRAGKRLRTSFRDYPRSQEGDAAICTLPQMIDSCSGTGSEK